MREKGTASYSGNFEVQKAAPLDARGKTATVADLILASTWTANDGLIYVFKGLSTMVTDDPTPSNNGIWWLSALPYSDPTNWKQIAGSTGGGGTAIVADTYANIKSLKDAGSLVPESTYIITDYQTKHVIQYSNPIVINEGNIEPLTLIAATTNTFYVEVKSSLFPTDIIHYRFDDDSCENGTRDSVNKKWIGGTARPGYIQYRKSTTNNLSTHYDWRNYKVRR